MVRYKCDKSEQSLFIKQLLLFILDDYRLTACMNIIKIAANQNQTSETVPDNRGEEVCRTSSLSPLPETSANMCGHQKKNAFTADFGGTHSTRIKPGNFFQTVKEDKASENGYVCADSQPDGAADDRRVYSTGKLFRAKEHVDFFEKVEAIVDDTFAGSEFLQLIGKRTGEDMITDPAGVPPSKCKMNS